MLRARVVILACLLAACGGSAKPASRPSKPKGPFYSTVPCAEQCGADPGCAAACTPVNQSLPPVRP